jgi:GT2 family glycosyltransferase
VVEDAAPVRTAEAARAALAAHHALARRTVLTLRRRLGPTGAFDLAVAEGTGEYVALVDVATRPAPGTLGTLLDELHEHPEALWAAAPAPGCAVVRRGPFLELGGFDPGLRDGEALRDVAARARAAGWKLLTVPDARVRREAPAAPAPRPPLRRRAAGPSRRPWSGAALAAWLPRVRRTAQRADLP